MTEKMRTALVESKRLLRIWQENAGHFVLSEAENDDINIACSQADMALLEPIEAESIPQLKGEITVLQQRIVELEQNITINNDKQITDAEKRGYVKALKEYAPTSAQILRLLKEARKEGQENKNCETIEKLLELPAQIKEQSTLLADASIEIEKLRAKIATAKLNAMEFVTSAKDSDKQRYSNDKARTAAQERLLADDTEYCANCDELGRLEYKQKLSEIEFTLLRDSFRATLVIAEMR